MGQGTSPLDPVWYRDSTYGSRNAQVPAGAATTTLSPGAPPDGAILATVVVTATGTAATSFYDVANGVVGAAVPLFTVPANAATGTVYTVRLPYTFGLAAVGIANSPALSVSLT